VDYDREPSRIAVLDGAAAGGAAGRALRPHPDVLAQTVDGTTVLVDTDRNRIYELNETAGDLWRMLGDGSDPDAIIDALVERYDAPAERIREEVETTLATLAAHRLLVPPGE
jgi:Trk K+ transport system NAD-binding subunit